MREKQDLLTHGSENSGRDGSWATAKILDVILEVLIDIRDIMAAKEK